MTYGGSVVAPFFGLRREIDRLFEDAVGRGDRMRGAWSPAVDVKETDRDLSLEFELPGISQDDVEISFENGVLTVRGEKREERKEEEEGRYHIIERTYGAFTRSFQLPQGVEDEQIEAEFDNGVLRVRIPKAAIQQPRRIQIGAGKRGEVGAQSERGQAGRQGGTESGRGSESGRGATKTRGRGQSDQAMAAKGKNE